MFLLLFILCYGHWATSNEADCISDIKYLETLLRELDFQALKAFDSVGKLPPSGILTGNIQKLGSFSSCLETLVKYENETRFEGKYCYIQSLPDEEEGDLLESQKVGSGFIQSGLIASSWIFRYGTCLPSSCSDENINRLLKAKFIYIPYGCALIKPETFRRMNLKMFEHPF